MVSNSEDTHRILLIGSGFVVPPCLDYLCRKLTNIVTIASLDIASAKKLAVQYSNVKVSDKLDVTNRIALDSLVSQHDIVISLIPYTFHTYVLESAIELKKPVVTTSYVSEAMAAYDQAAKDAGVTILNEIGLDPGLDHVFAMKMFEQVKNKGGKIVSFTSYCGGLPAPEASGNPLGYKFSWSSRGALLALRNDASYLKNNKIVNVSGKDLMEASQPFDVLPGFNTVGYPNRDSAVYKEKYQLHDAHSIIRGTLRYANFPTFVRALTAINLLDVDKKDYLSTDQTTISWQQILTKELGITNFDESEIEACLQSKIPWVEDDVNELKRVISGMRWLGLFSSEPIAKQPTLLDTLCQALESKMSYQEDERDMVLLHHIVEAEYLNTDNSVHRQQLTATLLEYGNPDKFTAMAKTVGTPCAIATQLILDGKIRCPGVQAPIIKDIYQPLYEVFVKEGIVCKENCLDY